MITPTTFADGGPGSGSLRDAVLQFNADPGSEDDTIQLLAGSYTLTLRNAGMRQENLAQTGDLDITSTAHRLIVQGEGPATIIDASRMQDRVFQIVNPGHGGGGGAGGPGQGGVCTPLAARSTFPAARSPATRPAAVTAATASASAASVAMEATALPDSAAASLSMPKPSR